MEDEIGVYRFEGVSSLWREIFPLGSTKSSTWGHRQVGVSTTLCLSLQKTNKQTVDATDDLCSTIRKRGRNNDLNHGFGQQFSSEQLQQRVHDVLPALPQDVAMPMSEVEHRLGGCLGLTVTAKHGGKILHRLCVGGGHKHYLHIWIHYCYWTTCRTTQLDHSQTLLFL